MSRSKKVCMRCRVVRQGTRCTRCGDELLDLSNEVDRSIVRTAIYAPAAGEMIAFLVAMGLFLVVFIAVRGHRGYILLLYPVAFGTAAAAMAMKRASRLRAWGLVASDLSSARARAARQLAWVEWLTGVPLWTMSLVVILAAARVSSPAVEELLAPLALRAGDLREGVIGPSFLGHALLHASALHLTANAVGLLLFGHAPRMRVRNGGALLLLLGGIAGGAAVHSLFWPQADATMVGISGGVYAWLVAPAVLDPKLHTVLVLRGIAIPMPMWLRVALSLVLFTGIDAIASAGSVAVLAHLGGAAAGLLLAIPLRRVKPTASYARWRAAHERFARSV